MSSRAEPSLVSAPGARHRAGRPAQCDACLARAARRPRDPDLRLPSPSRPAVELSPRQRGGPGAGGTLLGPRGGPAPGPGVRRRGSPGAPARRDRGRARAPAGDARAPARPLSRRAGPGAAALHGAGSSATSPTTPCACGSACRTGRRMTWASPCSAWALMDTVVVFDHRSHTLRDRGERVPRRGRGRRGRPGAGSRAHRPDPRAPPEPPAPGAAGRAGRAEPPLDGRRGLSQGGGAGAGAHPGGDIYQVVLSRRFAGPCRGWIRSPSTARCGWSTRRPTCSSSTPGTARRWSARSPRSCARRGRPDRDAAPGRHAPPRHATDEDDRPLAEELLADPKERAEHVMLVDLGRNDVGRVARYGTVGLDDVMMIERYSHVMHIASQRQRAARRGKTAFDALRACLPAGTVSGAPKVRAMEIIDDARSSGARSPGPSRTGQRVRRRSG